jgi:hypothetical protein
MFLGINSWTRLWEPMGAFLSSPFLIVMLILREHLEPVNSSQFATE